MKLVKRLRWEERIYRITEIIAISKKDNNEEILVSTEKFKELTDSGHIRDEITPENERLYSHLIKKY